MGIDRFGRGRRELEIMQERITVRPEGQDPWFSGVDSFEENGPASPSDMTDVEKLDLFIPSRDFPQQGKQEEQW